MFSLKKEGIEQAFIHSCTFSREIGRDSFRFKYSAMTHTEEDLNILRQYRIQAHAAEIPLDVKLPTDWFQQREMCNWVSILAGDKNTSACLPVLKERDRWIFLAAIKVRDKDLDELYQVRCAYWTHTDDQVRLTSIRFSHFILWSGSRGGYWAMGDWSNHMRREIAKRICLSMGLPMEGVW